MPSHLADSFTGDWRVDMASTGGRPVGGMLLLVHVTQCHAAWNALTSVSRTGLIRLGQDHHLSVHTQTREALERHGLLEPNRGPVTAAGREVLRYRPGQRPPRPSYPDVEIQPLDRRSFVDVHLPEGA